MCKRRTEESRAGQGLLVASVMFHMDGPAVRGLLEGVEHAHMHPIHKHELRPWVSAGAQGEEEEEVIVGVLALVGRESVVEQAAHP